MYLYLAFVGVFCRILLFSEKHKVHVHLYWYMKNCGANPNTMLHDYMNISKHFYVCVYVCVRVLQVHVLVYVCMHTFVCFECVCVLMCLCVYVNVSVCACVSRGLTCMCLLFRASI